MNDSESSLNHRIAVRVRELRAGLGISLERASSVTALYDYKPRTAEMMTYAEDAQQ